MSGQVWSGLSCSVPVCSALVAIPCAACGQFHHTESTIIVSRLLYPDWASIVLLRLLRAVQVAAANACPDQQLCLALLFESEHRT